jgi:hypothetical protein
MLSFLFHRSKLFSYSFQNATEGLSQNVSGIWKAKDQISFVVTWKLDLILYFIAQIPIYMSCSGEASIYAYCITDRERICGKMYVFSSGFNKKG